MKRWLLMTESLLMIDQLLMIQYVNDSLNVGLFCYSEEMVGGAEVPIISPAKKLEYLIPLMKGWLLITDSLLVTLNWSIFNDLLTLTYFVKQTK